VRALEDLDPFLLFDEIGPLLIPSAGPIRFPAHPHRGFEIGTYLLEGEMEHRDSRGRHDILRPGDLQWITAGAGLVHSEMPAPSLEQRGRFHGFQLWVNLPRDRKMMTPRYQEMAAAQVPVARNLNRDVEVRVLAGESFGRRSLIETQTPVAFLHFTLQPGAEYAQDVPLHWSACAYVISGQAEIGASRLNQGQLAIFAADGESIALSNPAAAQPADLLLFAGQPLHEPVARWGPFVMNTREEIAQAVEDFRAGRMGALAE